MYNKSDYPSKPCLWTCHKIVTAGVRSGIGDRSKQLYHHTMKMEQILERLLASQENDGKAGIKLRS
jgi:hypothetical protein